MLLQQGEEKGKGHLVNISKKLALLVDSSDLQFCIIGSLLYKSALLHSTFLRMWYISIKFHLNVTLKACRAEDHSKCQNSLMRPMTEFRISLCHIFPKWISKPKLCIWNLDVDVCCYLVSLPSRFSHPTPQFTSVFKAQCSWKEQSETLQKTTFLLRPLEDLIRIMGVFWIFIFVQVPIPLQNAENSTFHHLLSPRNQTLRERKKNPDPCSNQEQTQSLNNSQKLFKSIRHLNLT